MPDRNKADETIKKGKYVVTGHGRLSMFCFQYPYRTQSIARKKMLSYLEAEGNLKGLVVTLYDR
jgi:hypothetical protein